ncbi:MAG: tRNA lysidine(34) synthetase TilS [Cytophagaceae bacterium]|nr:tRNA lysidine(34) synthetase TilS [Cytophagaceae bacterium]
MLQSFCQHITQNKLFLPTDKVLLAVSGGLDSVVMTHLFHEAGFTFAIAHCNFQLRGEESDGDQEFVKALAQKYNVPFFLKTFDTLSFAESEKISTQMAARDLRYAWFNELATKENYQCIATAHHQNDVVESILLNLIKGTDIHGFQGVKVKTENIIRPLLFSNREEIRNYAEEKKLAWREDSSNESVKYQRNFIRHKIIPQLKEINPNFEETFLQTGEKLRAVENIFRENTEEIKRKFSKEEKDHVSIDIKAFNTETEGLIFLFEIMRPYNFKYTDVKNLLKSSGTGKLIGSDTHIAVRDREKFIITPRKNKTEDVQYISQEENKYQSGNFLLKISSIDNKNFTIPSSADIACVDGDKIKFPLQIRSWKEGDYFMPLGMNQKKKISDFLIDQKISLNLKENIKVLISEEAIVWVIGMRIDNRFRVSEHTTKILQFTKENL